MGATFGMVKSQSTGGTIYAADWNAEFVNILNNLTPAGVDDESSNATAMRATADPYPGSSESLATSLQGELQRIRYVLEEHGGGPYWYSPAPGPINVEGFGASTSASASVNTAAITAAIAATPAGGALEFGPGVVYSTNGTLTFNINRMGIRFNGCTINYLGHGTAIIIGADTTPSNNEVWIDGHVRIIRTETIIANGTETAVSQLLGTGVKFRNLYTAIIKGSMDVEGFKYGYHFSDATSVVEAHSLQGGTNLVDFYFYPETSGSFVTAVDIYSPFVSWDATNWLTQVGSRIVESGINGGTVNGINFFGGVLESAKERKVKWDGSWSSFNHSYWDISNTGTDIELTTNSTENIIMGGAALNLQKYTDAGTRNMIIDPNTMTLGLVPQSGIPAKSVGAFGGPRTGAGIVAGEKTLTPNTTTTTLDSYAMTADSTILLFPMTAHAAAIVASVYVGTIVPPNPVDYGAVNIHHPSSAETDLTFRWAIINK